MPGRRSAGTQAKVARFSTTVLSGCTGQPSASACVQHLAFHAAGVGLAGADHEGQQPGGAAQLRAVEDELRRVTRAGRQGQHGQRQPRPAGGVDGGDRLVLQPAARPPASRRRAGRRQRPAARASQAGQASSTASNRSPSTCQPRRARAATARGRPAAVRRRPVPASARPLPERPARGPRSGSSRLEAPQPSCGAPNKRVAQHAQEHRARWRARPAC